MNAGLRADGVWYHYCEGYFLGSQGLPVLHPWLVDSKGFAINLTSDKKNGECLGVLFPQEQVAAQFLRHGIWESVILNGLIAEVKQQVD